MKLLLWAVIAFVLVMWVLRVKKPTNSSQHDGSNRESPEAMLKCAHCGMYIPASEALVAKPGIVFCCEEHRLQHHGN